MEHLKLLLITLLLLSGSLTRANKIDSVYTVTLMESSKTTSMKLDFGNINKGEFNIPTDFIIASKSQNEKFKTNRTLKITGQPFGGIGVLFTNVNGQFTLMNGGRGSATFNNRFTIGGGGWGMPKGVEITTSKKDTFEFFKMGYGGIELGYIFYKSDKIQLGTNLLMAYGAGFKETVPKSKNGNSAMFPVLEPSVYSQISLGKMLKLDLGITYRYAGAANLSYINSQKLNGFSCYIAFLVGACNCE